MPKNNRTKSKLNKRLSLQLYQNMLDDVIANWLDSNPNKTDTMMIKEAIIAYILNEDCQQLNVFIANMVDTILNYKEQNKC